MSTRPCETCEFYWEIMRALARGGQKRTGRGHCLAHSVYASNMPGKPTYPPKAKTAELPYGRSNVIVVMGEACNPNCQDFKEKK
jgi:hypothetical protein